MTIAFSVSTFDHHHGLLCLALFLLTSPAAAQFPPPPPTDPWARLKFDKNMGIIMVILVLVFFILGFLSIYSRQCAERRLRGRLDLSLPIGISGRRPRGLDADIIDSFPTFVYSSVKGLKVGSTSLECAVCLNEFEDDETLRLIPKCSHVFHPECIDLWLSSHSTCPLCRANLVPKPGDSSFAAAVQIPNPDPDYSPEEVAAPESPILGRSKSTGFRFPRSHSTGHSLQLQNWERFTLRLPEDARRTNSCVAFSGERSQRRGFRATSVGSGRGRNYLLYERFGGEVRPPFLSRSASTVTARAPVGPSGLAMDDTGQPSSDPLFPAPSKDY